MKSLFSGFVTLTAFLVLGCDDPKVGAPPAAQRVATPQVKQARLDRESVERIYQRKWDRARKDFPIPETTAYDGNPTLRKAYLEGFREGLQVGLESMGHGDMMCNLS